MRSTWAGSSAPEAVPGAPGAVEGDRPRPAGEFTDDALRHGRRHVLRGGSVVFAGKLFTYGARIAMAILLARALGADQYGLYNLAITTATLIGTFAALGMDSAVVRYVAAFAARSDAAGIRGVLQVGLGLPTIIGITAGIGTFLLADQIAGLLGQPSVSGLLRVTAVLVPLSVVNRQLGAALQGFKRIELAVLAEQFAQPVVRMALLLLVIALVGLTAWNASLTATAAAGAATLLLLASLASRLTHVARARPTRPIRQMIVFALPVYFSNFVTTFGNNVQVFLLSMLGTLSAVGLFAVASQVTLISTLFHSSIVAATMPLFAELDERGDRDASGKLYRLTSRWTFALNLPFFLFVILFSTQLMGLFGADFIDGAPALIVLALAGLVNASTGTSGALLDMSGYTRMKLINATFGVLASLLLSLALIPPFGLIGAAVAMLGATASVNVLRLIQLRLLTGLSPYDRSFLLPLAAALPATAAAVAVLIVAASLPELVQVILGTSALLLIYAVVLMRFGLSADDRAFLGGVRGRLLRRSRGAPSDSSTLDGPDD